MYEFNVLYSIAQQLEIAYRGRHVLFPISLSHRLLTWNLSLRFNGHFPGEPGLAGVY